jgi:manganese/zinc/iron transport system permease protein
MNTALEGMWRALSLSDYNTRVVLSGTALLGVAAGLVGVYLLLRKRALLGDAISHATLPGVAGVFLWSVAAGVPRSLGLLMVGAAITGSLGGLAVLALRYTARIREDAALGIVLSVFFGIGIALVGIVQQIPGGNAAGLESFIYGKAASMTWSDARLIGSVALASLLVLVLLSKELTLLCFDPQLARSQGWPVLALDTLLIGLVVVVTIVGLQAVGLILVIALLIVPAASARFWSDRLNTILGVSALAGGLSCTVGTLLSAGVDELPGGATIVLCACCFFLISFAFGYQRGLVWGLVRRWRLIRQQHDEHLLRALFEHLEAAGKLTEGAPTRGSDPVPLDEVACARGWSQFLTRRVAVRVERRGLVTCLPDATLTLTPRGVVSARQLVRDHRLLEHYFLDQIAASEGQADLGADYFEHALPPELAWQIDGRFALDPALPLPASPHPLGNVRSSADPAPNATPDRHAAQDPAGNSGVVETGRADRQEEA